MHCGRSLDYLFQLAVEMKKLGLTWIPDTDTTRALDEKE